MAKGQYIGVNNVARKVTKQYIGVNNVARKVTKGYIGVNNVARQCFAGGVPVSELEVGSSVYMNVDGVPTEFIVIHQGNPDATIYDSSCDGTWLMRKSIETTIAWRSYDTARTYSESSVHHYLKNTVSKNYSNYLDIIKEVKIPYNTFDSISTNLVTTHTKENGLPTKLFVLSPSEVGNGSDWIGSCLDYFGGSSAEYRRRANNVLGEPETWWLRSMTGKDSAYGTAYRVEKNGTIDDYTSTYGGGIRPALILPSNALVDDEFNVITK